MTPQLPPPGETVLLALSGGVDSALAAALLKERGCIVVGAFMKMWSDTKDVQGQCAWISERQDAYRVAARLDIPVMTLDFEEVYRTEVMSEFFRAYEAGETPNPDILCNSRIKFPLLRAEAARRGIRWIATGHYANVSVDATGARHLFAGVDPEKDQTYFLSGLSQEDLEYTAFPIGQLLKKTVREEARARGLVVADKRSTRGICFVGKVSLPDFLRQKIRDAHGTVVTTSGAVIGEHAGVHGFTLGQRHGFAIGGGKPYYVCGKDVATQTVVVTQDVRDLEATSIKLASLHWVNGAPDPAMPLFARARYRAPLVSVTRRDEEVVFSTPQRAVTPGQYLVFYAHDGECLGNAVIAPF